MMRDVTTTPRRLLQGSRIVSWINRCATQGRTLVRIGCARVVHQAAWQAVVRGWQTAPLSAGGLMLVAAVLANWVCVWWLRRTMEPFGIAQRALLLAIGWLGAGHTGDWTAVRQGSWLMHVPDGSGARRPARVRGTEAS